jgi:hypothetical protein
VHTEHDGSTAGAWGDAGLAGRPQPKGRVLGETAAPLDRLDDQFAVGSARGRYRIIHAPGSECGCDDGPARIGARRAGLPAAAAVLPFRRQHRPRPVLMEESPSLTWCTLDSLQHGHTHDEVLWYANWRADYEDAQQDRRRTVAPGCDPGRRLRTTMADQVARPLREMTGWSHRSSMPQVSPGFCARLGRRPSHDSARWRLSAGPSSR